MRREKKLWIAFALVMSISFAVLGYYGYEIYQKAPPIPLKIVSADNKTIFTEQEIKDGQNIWQSMGGQEVGTIWGHGAYVLLTGLPIGCIAKQFLYWINYHKVNSKKTLQIYLMSSKP